MLGEAVLSAIVKNSIDEQFFVTVTKQESYEVLIRSMKPDPGMVFNMAQGFIGIKTLIKLDNLNIDTLKTRPARWFVEACVLIQQFLLLSA